MTDRWTDDGCTDAQKNNGRIPPSGLGEDSVTDRWTDGGLYNIPIAFYTPPHNSGRVWFHVGCP